MQIKMAETEKQLDNYVAKLPAVRIVCEKDPTYSLAIRSGNLTLAPTNPSDPTQSWVKVDRSSKWKKDDEGFPVFHLVNKETGQAVKHSADALVQLELTPFKPPLTDSTLWSQPDSTDVYREIRKANNTTLIWNALGGHVYEGVAIGFWIPTQGAKNQFWAIVPFSSPTALLETVAALLPYRVISKANTNFSLTIRNGKVTLARNDKTDPLQRWVMFDKWSSPATDAQGFPAFALVNIATGQAIKQVDNGQQVQLTPFNPESRDDSTLWIQNKSSEDAFTEIRKAKNTTHVLNALGGLIFEGMGIGLWDWTAGAANQYWAMAPYN